MITSVHWLVCWGDDARLCARTVLQVHINVLSLYLGVQAFTALLEHRVQLCLICAQHTQCQARTPDDGTLQLTRVKRRPAETTLLR
jgi:hypothetical protein